MDIMEYAKNAEINVSSCLSEDDKLILFVKTNYEKVKGLLDCKLIITDVLYNQEYKGIVIGIAPVDDVNVVSNYEETYKKNGVVGLVNSEQGINILKRVVKTGLPLISFFIISEDLSIWSEKGLFNSDESIIVLERALNLMESVS